MEQDITNSWKSKLFKGNVNIGRAKVPAKLIISGEHAVLYNVRALTCAINLWMNVEVRKTFRYRIVVEQDRKKTVIPLDDAFPENKMDNPLCEIYRQFVLFTECDVYGIMVKIDTEIPSRCGLGSSAALVVGMIKALDDLFQTHLSPYKMTLLAKNCENIFHGKSSGIDVQTILRKGIVSFDNGKVRNYRQKFNKICVIDTGKPQFSTKEVVEFVARTNINDRRLWENFCDITNGIEKNIFTKTKEVNDLIEQNEHLLEYIGIVSKKTAAFIKILKKYDIHAKVCGAGTIGTQEKFANNGVVAVFHELDKYQKQKLQKTCRIFKFKLKFAEIVY